MIDYNHVILQNPWWDNKLNINQDIKLKELAQLKYPYTPKQVLKLKLEKEAVHLIMGPRQTGKSTSIKLYMRKLLQDNYPPHAILFFNCDALSTSQDIINLILEFGKTYNHNHKAIFLDEISQIPNWSQAIKWLADAGQLQNSTLYLTGSSSINLKKSGELLPGRRGNGQDVLYLPISFNEFLQLKGKNIDKISSINKIDRLHLGIKIQDRDFEQFLLYGGFLRNLNYNMTQDNLALYLASLRSELYKANKKEASLREVVRKLLASLSSQTSYTNIAQEAELGSKNTAIEYLSFLEDSFFMQEVKFYNIAQGKPVLKKNKKYYSTDPYLIWLLTSFVTGSLDFSAIEKLHQLPTEKAKLVENYVASELYKSHVSFYFSQNKHEIDFYVPSAKIALEVKYKNKITTTDIRPLQKLQIPDNWHRIVVTKNTFETRENLLLIPASLLTSLDVWPKKA